MRLGRVNVLCSADEPVVELPLMGNDVNRWNHPL